MLSLFFMTWLLLAYCILFYILILYLYATSNEHSCYNVFARRMGLQNPFQGGGNPNATFDQFAGLRRSDTMDKRVSYLDRIKKFGNELVIDPERECSICL